MKGEKVEERNNGSTYVPQFEKQRKIASHSYHDKTHQHSNYCQEVGTLSQVELFQKLDGVPKMTIRLRATERRTLPVVDG
jgi:hypothetical protein